MKTKTILAALVLSSLTVIGTGFTVVQMDKEVYTHVSALKQLDTLYDKINPKVSDSTLTKLENQANKLEDDITYAKADVSKFAVCKVKQVLTENGETVQNESSDDGYSSRWIGKNQLVTVFYNKEQVINYNLNYNEIMKEYFASTTKGDMTTTVVMSIKNDTMNLRTVFTNTDPNYRNQIDYYCK